MRADGWAWEAGERVSMRKVLTQVSGDSPLTAEAEIPVASRPLVLVHGLNSDHTSWIRWIEPDGYLQEVGLPGYAIDDEQFGTRRMNTGDPKKPLTATFSIAENAQVLADYIEAVRANTGADARRSGGSQPGRVDLSVLHPEPDANDHRRGLTRARLPSTSSLSPAPPTVALACGRPGAALRLFSPATSQITPEYLAQVFNPAVHDRRGVPSSPSPGMP